MKLLILSIVAFGLSAFADSDPNNTFRPTHLEPKFKAQTCAFAKKNADKQAATSRDHKQTGEGLN